MNEVEDTCDYQCWRKIKFLEIFHFQLIYISKSKNSPSLKFLQTFKRIEDGAWFCVNVLSLAN